MRRVSECVSVGHPDKTADYISEALLDFYLEHDSNVRFALETQIKGNYVTIAGEVTSTFKPTRAEMTEVVKNAVRYIGYTKEYCEEWNGMCTNADALKVAYHIDTQSPDISQGVDNGGWGDQGIFWGMATTSEDDFYMPHDIYIARKICEHLLFSRRGGIDIKSQVYTRYNEVDNIVVAIPLHDKNDRKTVKDEILALLDVVLPYKFKGTLYVNGTGDFVQHGSYADCGTTGRKLAVDFYGGNCQIGGGSPWTKDYTKADLSLNILARNMAVKYAKEYNDTIKVALACRIGSPEIDIDVFDSKERQIEHDIAIATPNDVATMFCLDRPIYKDLCKEGLTYYATNKH